MSLRELARKMGDSPESDLFYIRVLKATREIYAEAAATLKKGFGLIEPPRFTQERLMAMVVASATKMVLVMGFKSGFLLYPGENANAKGLIGALLQRAENEKEDTEVDGAAGGVSLSDIADLKPGVRDQLLLIVLRESLSMCLALRYSLEQSFGHAIDLDKLQKVVYQNMKDKKTFDFAEAILEAREQSQHHGHYPKH